MQSCNAALLIGAIQVAGAFPGIEVVAAVAVLLREPGGRERGKWLFLDKTTSQSLYRVTRISNPLRAVSRVTFSFLVVPLKQ